MSRALTLRRRALATVLLAFLLVSMNAGAEVAPPAPEPALLLTTGDNYPPFTGSDLPEGGMVTDIVRQAFRKSGLEVKIHWLPFARGLYETQSGSYAATFPYIHTPDRDRAFLFSDPLLDLVETFFVRKGLVIDPNQAETLRGRILCQPVGWGSTETMESLARSKLVTVVRPADIDQCVKMLLAGHADFFDSDFQQGQATLAGSGVKSGEIQALLTSVPVTSAHLIVSRNWPGGSELVERFNRGLRALRAGGEYDRIVAAHSKGAVTEPAGPSPPR